MKSLATLLALVLLTSATFAEGTFPATTGEAIHINTTDGKVIGQVFTLFENEKAPVKGKVSLTDLDGKTISTSKTDDKGHFTFSDVEPGTYQAIGVAGDYVGNTKIVVSELRESTETEDVYTAIPLPVAPAASSAIFDSYASLPAASFSPAPSFGFGGGSVGGCSSCGGGSGGGLGLRSFGGSCGGGCSGCCGGGGGLSFRRLALIGGAIAIPLALSGGDDDAASPVE